MIYFFVMWGRFIVDLVRTFNRNWRPRGFLLVVVETVYAVTDPLVRLFRRFIPPIRFGQVSLDLAWSLALLLVIILMSIVQTLAIAAMR
nr:YggT family protein [Agromyces seonyuensis]